MSAAATLLADFGRRRRNLALVTSAVWALSVFLVWMIVGCLLDRLLPLSTTLRVASLCLASVGSAVVIVLAAVRNRRLVAVDHAAVIERADPDLGERLLTLASVPRRGSEQILAHLDAQIARWLQELSVTPRPGRRPLIFACLVVLTLLAATDGLLHFQRIEFARLLQRFCSPLTLLPPVGVLTWDVLPGDCSIPEGTGLKISATVPERVGSAMLNLSSDGGKSWRIEPMHTDSGRTFTINFPPIADDTKYYIAAGSVLSPVYTAHLLRRPGVSEFKIRVSYPSAAKHSPVSTVNTDGLLEGPAGAEITVDFVCTEPVAQLIFSRGNEHLISRPTGDDRVRRISFTLRKDGRYELSLRSDAGVTATRTGLSIKVAPDGEPPGFDEAIRQFRQRTRPFPHP